MKAICENTILIVTVNFNELQQICSFHKQVFRVKFCVTVRLEMTQRNVTPPCLPPLLSPSIHPSFCRSPQLRFTLKGSLAHLQCAHIFCLLLMQLILHTPSSHAAHCLPVHLLHPHHTRQPPPITAFGHGQVFTDAGLRTFCKYVRGRVRACLCVCAGRP